MKQRLINALPMLLIVLFLAGCGPKTGPRVDLKRVSPPPVRELADDLDRESLVRAVNLSLAYLKRLPPQRPVKLGQESTTAQGMIFSLEEVLRLVNLHGLGPQFFRALQEDFQFFSAADQVLFTGYYEPLLDGREEPDQAHPTPLLAPPDDLVILNLKDFGLEPKIIRGRVQGRRLVPYHTREEIGQGALAEKGRPLAWVDPVDAFFLHIQGSGRVRLPDGREILVNYADQNGHPYVSLGKVMIERGLMAKEDVSLQSLKDYLRSHPREMDELLAANPSFVFFRVVEDGPLGCLEVPLTPGRSVALDRKVYPDACLGLIRVNLPLIRDGRIETWEEKTRLVLVQDTGGAIRGPSRLDLFFGHGEEAEIGAGNMKEQGRFLIMIHKKVLAR